MSWKHGPPWDAKQSRGRLRSLPQNEVTIKKNKSMNGEGQDELIAARCVMLPHGIQPIQATSRENI